MLFLTCVTNKSQKLLIVFQPTEGDVYLKTFAHSLQKAIGSRGDVFRFAGDEFVCVTHMT